MKAGQINDVFYWYAGLLHIERVARCLSNGYKLSCNKVSWMNHSVHHALSCTVMQSRAALVPGTARPHHKLSVWNCTGEHRDGWGRGMINSSQLGSPLHQWLEIKVKHRVVIRKVWKVICSICPLFAYACIRACVILVINFNTSFAAAGANSWFAGDHCPHVALLLLMSGLGTMRGFIPANTSRCRDAATVLHHQTPSPAVHRCLADIKAMFDNTNTRRKCLLKCPHLVELAC